MKYNIDAKIQALDKGVKALWEEIARKTHEIEDLKRAIFVLQEMGDELYALQKQSQPKPQVQPDDPGVMTGSG